VGKVLALLRKLGVDAEHVQTEYAEVSPEYVSCDSDQRRTVACDPTRISYYDLKKGISLRVSDLSKFETIISEALQSGVTNITNVQFVTTDMRKYQDQARDLAVRAAREKATAVAGALGQKVGKPLTISVDGKMSYLGASGRQQFGYAAAAQNVTAIGGMVIGSNFESTVSLGTTKVTAQVGVVFELE